MHTQVMYIVHCTVGVYPNVEQNMICSREVSAHTVTTTVKHENTYIYMNAVAIHLFGLACNTITPQQYYFANRDDSFLPDFPPRAHTHTHSGSGSAHHIKITTNKYCLRGIVLRLLLPIIFRIQFVRIRGSAHMHGTEESRQQKIKWNKFRIYYFSVFQI